MVDGIQIRLVRMFFWDATSHRPTAMHIGGDRQGVEHVSPVIHSDMLFSAICHAWVDCFGTADLEETLLHRMQDSIPDPPLRLSAAFFYQGSPTHFFLPKPLLPLPGQSSPVSEVRETYGKYAQRLKGMVYITLSALLEWLAWEEKEDAETYERFYTRMVTDSGTWADLWLAYGLQANEVSRDTGHTNTFTRGVARFDQAGLPGYYFLISYTKEAMAEGLPGRLDDVLSTLAEVGIGGERSLGLGQWEYGGQEALEEALNRDWHRLFCHTPHREAVYLLSLYYPATEEFTDPNDIAQSQYHLVSRKGWFDSPTGIQMKRKSCRMLGEGSILHMPRSRLPRGKLVDVSPTGWEAEAMRERLGKRWHPIYRNGLALTVPL